MASALRKLAMTGVESTAGTDTRRCIHVCRRTLRDSTPWPGEGSSVGPQWCHACDVKGSKKRHTCLKKGAKRGPRKVHRR